MSSIWQRVASAAALALAASTTQAGVESQQIEFAWDVANGNEPVTFDVAQFDDQGGTRVLESVKFEVETFYSLGMLVENLEEFAVSEGEWFVDSALLMQLWVSGEIEGFIGGAGLGVFSTDLAGNDGVPQEGPDSAFWDYKGSVEASYDVPAAGRAQFVGAGLTEAGFYPYLSLGISAPPPLYDLWIQFHQNFGTMTVTYTFSGGSAPCPADVSGDGTVDFNDVLSVLSAWGVCGECAEDVDLDGVVGFADLLEVLADWGDCD